LKYYETFSEKVKETKRKLLEFLIKAKREGKTVAGYVPREKGIRFSIFVAFDKIFWIILSTVMYTNKESICQVLIFLFAIPIK